MDNFQIKILSLQKEIKELKNKLEKKSLDFRLYKSHFDDFIENVQVGIFRSDLKTSQILSLNQKLADIFEVQKETIQKNPRLIHWADSQERRKLIRQVLKHGNCSDYEIDIITKSGKRKTVLASITLYPEENFIEGAIIDINERKKIETKLKKSETKFRELFEKTKDALLIIENNKFVDCNQATVDMLMYKNKRDFLQVHPSVLSPEFQPDGRKSIEKADEMIALAIEKGSHRFEWVHKKKNNDEFPVEVLLTVITYSSVKKVIHTVWRDITQRKNSAEAILNSLAEKEVLLQEIHHRVKNNLQLISSMLNIQASSSSDEKVKNLLQSSRNRVRSMALIHQRLYMFNNLREIEFEHYLKDLTRELITIYSKDKNIKIKINAKNILLAIEVAVPCALITNELVSNSLEHAFVNKNEGEITIDLKRINDDFTLIIRDNGIGFSDNFDFQKNNSIGLLLVKTLAEQLKGKLKFVNNRGCFISISFSN